MEKRFLTLFLFVSLTCSAQLPVVPMTLISASSGFPFNANLAYRWISDDLATNTAISGNWTDRIQGASWLMANSANQPTNAALGIWFDATHFLTNNGLPTVTSNVTFGFIMDMIDCGKFSGAIHPGLLFNNAKKVSDDSHNYGYCFDFTSSAWPLSVEVGGTFTHFSPDPFRVTNQWCDLIMTHWVTNISGTLSIGIACITNGIGGITNVGTGNSSSGFWGNPGANMYNAWPNSLAFNWTRTTSSLLRLRELWVWTNGAINVTNGQPLTATAISNFHFWRTNLPPNGLGLP